MKKMYLLLIIVLASCPSWSQYTAIPDPVFEQYLIDSGIDNDNGSTLDQQVLTANLAEVTFVYVSGLGITDLTGIKSFTNLQYLYCDSNPGLTQLDVSGLDQLLGLSVNYTGLASLNLAGLTSLQSLDCSYNGNLTSIDATGLDALVYLYCSNNQLTSLIVGGLQSLFSIEARYNSLTSLDLSGLISLKEVFCPYNQLTSLDISGTTLESLDCFYNAFVTLDMTDFPDSASLECYQNSSLICIQVSDVAVAEGNSNWLKDQDAVYALNCGGVTLIPDPNFEQALIDNGIDDVLDGKVNSAAALSAGYINASGYGITDMTGLQDFTNLGVLECDNNSITSLPLAGLANLFFLKLDNNQVTTLDLSATPNMMQLYCKNNQISTLDFTGLADLEAVECSGNQITTLDFSNKPLLVQIGVSNNPLTSMNVQGSTMLKVIDSDATALTSLDVSGLSNLMYLSLFVGELTSLNVAGATALNYLDCDDNALAALDLTGLSNLEQLYCSYNQLEALDLTPSPDLFVMYASNNPLTCIKVADVEAAENQYYFDKDPEDYYSLTCNCVQTVTWNGTSWSPSAPLADQKAIIAGNYTSTGNLEVCSLEVTGTAEVTIAEGHNLIVGGTVAVAPTAQLVFSNGANLLQDPLATTNTNTGSIVFHKDSNALYNLDYTLWSSPTSGSQTLKNFSPGTLDASFFVYNTVLSAYSNYQSQSGIFGSHPNAVMFAPAKGYLVRMPAGLPAAATSVFNAEFEGIPNNGNVAIALSDEGGRFNAVGNPYPSPISIRDFIDANQSQMDNGTLYFWRKTNGAATATYITVTNMGSASVDSPSDSSGSFTGDPSTWIIQPGQGFLFKAAENAISLVFQNTMRRGTGSGTFFRPAVPANETMTDSSTELSRLWLDISNGASSFGQTVIGYSNATTDGLDFGWDGRLYNDSDLSIYTKSGDAKLSIQARASFTPTDVVPVSYKANNAGTFSINMSNYDGLLAGEQQVYLKDNMFNAFHDMKEGAYAFSSEAGTFENRFEIVYQNATLGAGHPSFDTSTIILYKEGTILNIDAGKVTMKEISIYDVRGRLLYSNANVNAVQFAIDNLAAEQQVLIVQVMGEDDSRTSKKIIY